MLPVAGAALSRPFPAPLTLSAQATCHFDLSPLLHFVLFALISTPPNYAWQQALEARFPSGRGARSTLSKFLADQLLAGPLNTLLFVAAMGWLRGEPDVAAYARAQFWPLTAAGLRVWPLVSLLSFALVPAPKRVLFGSVVALAWNVWLGLAVH